MSSMEPGRSGRAFFSFAYVCPGIVSQATGVELVPGDSKRRGLAASNTPLQCCGSREHHTATDGTSLFCRQPGSTAAFSVHGSLPWRLASASSTSVSAASRDLPVASLFLRLDRTTGRFFSNHTGEV